MNIEDIAKFFALKATLNEDYIKITFKKRKSIFGLFLQGADYSHLKSKYFWRIVPQGQLEAYKTSKDAALTRLFNGGEFSKLAMYKETVE